MGRTNTDKYGHDIRMGESRRAFLTVPNQHAHTKGYTCLRNAAVRRERVAPMSTPNRSMQKPPEPEGYSWSRTRVTEQITSNVASATIIALLLALGAFFGSSIGLLLQQFFQYIVIPTNLLTAIAFLSLGVLIAVAAIVGLAYFALGRAIRKYPVAFAIAIIGISVAAATLDPTARAKYAEGMEEIRRKTQTPPAP
jgi:hypothetical protein